MFTEDGCHCEGLDLWIYTVFSCSSKAQCSRYCILLLLRLLILISVYIKVPLPPQYLIILWRYIGEWTLSVSTQKRWMVGFLLPWKKSPTPMWHENGKRDLPFEMVCVIISRSSLCEVTATVHKVCFLKHNEWNKSHSSLHIDLIGEEAGSPSSLLLWQRWSLIYLPFLLCVLS
jgi:hypothetical protein